ncbi:MAG: DUF6020 family protein [Clostridium sp.]
MKNLTTVLDKKLYGDNGICEKNHGFKTYIFIYLLTGLFFFVTFLAVYPGIYSYDASVQVLQFFGDKPITTHHPLLHTLFLCGCLKAGEILFGSFQAGMAIHSVLQSALLGAVFSYVIWRMIQKKRPVIVVVLSYLFLVVNPYMQIFAFITTKDILFGAAFLMLFLFAMDMLNDINGFFHSKWLQIRFCFIALLTCFLRNQGIYVLLFFGIIYFIYLLKKSGFQSFLHSFAAQWLLLLTIAAGSYLIVNGPVFTAIGVEKGDPKEMLSVPMQQLARAYQEEPELLTEEESAYICELIPTEYLEQYVSVNADPVKNGFRTEVMKKDPGKFLSTWAAIGMKMPKVYIDSFLLGNWGYWYPLETQYWINYIVFDGAFMDREYNVLNIHRNSHFPQYEEYLRNISLTPAFEKIPILSILLNQAFPFWLMLVAAAFLIYFKKYKLLIPLTLILGYWGTLMLGPVTSVRYAFPLMICVPSLFTLLLDSASSE